MFLGIDVGNSNTVIGLVDDEGVKQIWRISTDYRSTSDELKIKLDALLGGRYDATHISSSAICSVVPSLTFAWDECVYTLLKLRTLVVTAELEVGMIYELDNPRELGADRIVNAYMAYKDLSRDLIIVDFGTATTFDVIDRPGIYKGGAIVPGLEISAESLFNKAAKLSRVELSAPQSAIGKNTTDSIRSGLIYGTASMVKGMVEIIENEAGKTYFVVGTGGICSLIAPHTARIDHVDEDLTIRGLFELSKLQNNRLKTVTSS